MQKTLNILCCTTRQWNPGDEWISLGIRTLFKRILKGRLVNWVLYDRSPDCFIAPWESGVRRTLLGNSYQPDGPTDVFDLAIAAGTPEWRGPHFQSVFSTTIKTPWLFLGIDHVSDEQIRLTSEEISVLSRACLVTRGPLGKEALVNFGLEAHAMPCPSLFAAAWERPSRHIKKIGVVLQGNRVVNQRIEKESTSSILRLLRNLQKHYEVVVLCNYIDEFLEFQGKLEVPVLYSYDSNDYLDIMSSCDVIVSTRLHSAFLANSLLKPSVVLNNSDRVTSAVSLYPYVFSLEPSGVLRWLQDLNMESTVRNLLNWKRLQEREYERFIIEQLRQNDLYQL